MPNLTDAESIAGAVYELETNARKATVRDILIDLEDSLKHGPIDGDIDTWESGFRAAMLTISENS